MNSNINLLPERKKNQRSLLPQHLKIARIAAVSLLFVVSVFTIILYILIGLSPLPQLKQQENLATSALVQAHPDIARLLFVNERTKSISQLLANRSSFDEQIDSLQSKLSGDVSIKNIAIKKDNIIVTVSSTSLLSIDTFLKSVLDSQLAKKEYSHITMTSLALGDQKNSFQLVLTLSVL